MNATNSDIKAILSEILECKPEDITDDIDLAELGFDSLKFINLIVELEAKYDIEIFDSDLVVDKFKSVTSILETLAKYFDDIPPRLYKCVITDCDGVLWRGISGEDGDDSPYTDETTNRFCERLHELRERGVLLVICSKNERGNIESMLKNTPLSTEDFALIETDAADKADTISYILSEFGFLVDSAVYVDDSDSELEFIKAKLPELTVVSARNDDYVDKLSSLFANLPAAEAIDRTEQFREQKEREKLHKSTASPEEFNRILKTKTTISEASNDNVERLAELSQRANRFNLTGARYTAEEIAGMLEAADYTVYMLSASDKLGDMGLVAFTVLHSNVIESFFMSCRVFGRGFEYELIDEIRQNHKDGLIGIYHPTGKNDYCKEFYQNRGVKYELR